MSFLETAPAEIYEWIGLNPRSSANGHTDAVSQKSSKHSAHTCFFKLPRALSSVDARADFDAGACHVPHRRMSSRAAFFACRGSAGSLATAPRRKHHARACLPCTLHGSCPASHCAGMAAGKWRSSTFWPRRWAQSCETSLPVASALGGHNGRCKSSRRGRAQYFSGGGASAVFHRLLQCHRSAGTLRARAAQVAERGQDDALATPGAWRAAVCRVRGARRSRSGSLHMRSEFRLYIGGSEYLVLCELGVRDLY